MADLFKGSEIKFSIKLEAEGFSMDDDDFDIEVASKKHSVKGSKGGSSLDVRIFREPALDEDSSDSDSSAEEGTWYAIVKTETLDLGDLRVISTSHIPDANADDGIRSEIQTSPLGKLKNP